MQKSTVKTQSINNKVLFKSLSGHPPWLVSFIDIYQILSTDNLSLLSKIYHEDVIFIDPMHQIEGFDNLSQYFKNLYENLSSCTFVIEDVLLDNDQASLYWSMCYQHAKLNHGNPVTVLGSSHIKGSGDKVIYHRDYLDLGAMLYEQLPVFGKLTKWFKKQAVK